MSTSTLAPAADLADDAVTPGALLDRVRTARRTADAAEVELLVLAVEWAHAHPVLRGQEAWGVPSALSTPSAAPGTADDPDADVAGDELSGIPLVRWDAPAAFAAANAMSTRPGRR
ncbi:hypothetical protein [Nocardioides deserti]|uniref:Amidase n=1 Tax=Nocardioides deserti TaxID=1588644 RepID=A0ABR6U5L1_9ACTN|nr:hypothetical protein [Nocardioides deserti]MBC2959716.1 hypothetical protein [Nocardioides deserti]GGO74360.1 hypothetical protein GCM10012276_22200 [Nocardioides deserti]